MDAEIFEVEEIVDAGVGKRLGYVDVPAGPEGTTTRMPFAVVTGSRPGPTAWVNACLHGDEYLGAATVARDYQRLLPGHVLGRIMLTPAFNRGAFRALQRTDPARPVDLNRLWSPAQDASRSHPLVEWAVSELLPRCDVVIDLHSGGNRFMQEAFAVYPCVGGEAEDRSARLAKASGLRFVWAHRDSLLEGGLVTAAARMGKPAVLLEIGGEGKAEPGWVRDATAALDGALTEAGLLRGRPRFRKTYRVFGGFTVLRNRQEGLWSRRVEPAAGVREGGAVGTVSDLFGREIETVTSPVDASVLGICTYGFVPAEDYIAELAHGFRIEGPP